MPARSSLALTGAQPVSLGHDDDDDLFDVDGRYLTSVLEEDVEIGNADEVDAEGRLYTVVTDPYPHIRRYRVVIDDGSP